MMMLERNWTATGTRVAVSTAFYFGSKSWIANY